MPNKWVGWRHHSGYQSPEAQIANLEGRERVVLEIYPDFGCWVVKVTAKPYHMKEEVIFQDVREHRAWATAVAEGVLLNHCFEKALQAFEPRL